MYCIYFEKDKKFFEFVGKTFKSIEDCEQYILDNKNDWYSEERYVYHICELKTQKKVKIEATLTQL